MPRGGQNRFPQDVVDRIRYLIEVEKLQQKKVAAQLGISVSAVERICKRNKIKTQRTGPRYGEGSPLWKGGRFLIGRYWYVYAPDHPHTTKRRMVAEHRLVAEAKLGRYLEPHEVVHHIDGDPQNNHPDNLIVFQTNSQHLKEELKGRVPKWTPEGIEGIREGHRLATIRRKLERNGDPLPLPNDH